MRPIPLMIKLARIMTGCAFLCPALHAAEFYVDPVAGSPSGDGSAGNPWQTLEQVIHDNLIETRDWVSLPPDADTPFEVINAGAPIKAGDTIYLRSGYHGELYVIGAYNAAPITIRAEDGHTPLLSQVFLRSASHWIIDGVSISSHHASPPADISNMVSFVNHGHSGPSDNLVLKNSEVFTVDDASGWGATEWMTTADSGIRLDARDSAVIDSVVRNVRFGISVTGANALISGNLIDGISADGLRGLGDNGVFEYNRIQNMFVSSSQGDANHDDGFQSWSVGEGGVGTGEVNNVVLRGNVFINYTDLGNPLNAPMQGIGCFDGQFVNWTVENNVVITNHWHGISFYGMRDSRIVNNTVIDITPGQPGPSWIRVFPYGGIDSSDVVVRNNLANSYSVEGNSMVMDHNMTIDDANTLFVAPPLDLRLLETSPAIDAGSAVLAPDLDILGFPRTFGSAPDLGAYEFGDWVFVNGFEG